MIDALYAYLFWILLAITTSAAWIWGGQPGALFTPERTTATLFVIAAVATLLFLPPEGSRYRRVETGALAIDVLLTIALVCIAVRADRWWPIWVTAFQLVSTIAHFARWASGSPDPAGYQIIEQVSSYPTQIGLAVGIWCQHRRMEVRHAGRTSGS